MQILWVGTIHGSKRDANGNRYWALHAVRTSDGAQAHVIVDGESNARAALYELSGGSDRFYCTIALHGKREFRALTQMWPYVGCPGKTVAAGILARLEQEPAYRGWAE